MKLWKSYYHDPDHGIVVRWFSTRREAERHQREIAKDEDAAPGNIEAVNVPTDKAGLLNWLNIWVTTDNE